MRALQVRDTPSGMPQSKVDVARQAVDAYNRRDVEGFFAELGTTDFEWYPAIAKALDGSGDGYRGREGVEQFAADTGENWEELQNTAAEFRDLGDRVLVLGRLQGRGKGSGAPVDQPYTGIFDFRGDRICRYRVYLDRAEGLQAAGVLE
jgi:ketosteroid isomerase-like protein